MNLRHAGALAILVALVPAVGLAVETGKAEGAIMINHKAVNLKYAFARKEKDTSEKDRWVVILTDRAVSRSMLADDSRFDKVVENGDVVAAVLHFDNARKLEFVEACSNVLQRRSSFGSDEMKLTGLAFSPSAIEGTAATPQPRKFGIDTVALDVKFRAPLGNEVSFGENMQAAKDLAASWPKLTDGSALGSLKVDGQTVKLAYAIARIQPSVYDKKQTDVVILLTQKPVSAELFFDDEKFYDAMLNGSVVGLKVNLDLDERPLSLAILHPKGRMDRSGSGIFNSGGSRMAFDATDFSEKHVTARFFTTSDEDFQEHKYSYDVTFATAVQKIVVPAEITLDASSGTKLPPGGGEPGKAYMAFDEASRQGNIAELKKCASGSKPFPEIRPEDMKQVSDILKSNRAKITNVHIIEGFVNGDHATLQISAQNAADKSNREGRVELAREGGAWKILVEKWKS